MAHSLFPKIREQLYKMELFARLNPSRKVHVKGNRIHQGKPNFEGMVDVFGIHQLTVIDADGERDRIPMQDIYVVQATNLPAEEQSFA